MVENEKKGRATNRARCVRNVCAQISYCTNGDTNGWKRAYGYITIFSIEKTKSKFPTIKLNVPNRRTIIIVNKTRDVRVKYRKRRVRAFRYCAVTNAVSLRARRMSERRTLLSRPRTRVYDCNYNIGEGYYKPMMDHLDRKYYGSSATPAAVKPAVGFFDNPKSLFGPSGTAAAFDEFRSLSPIRSRRSGSDSRLSLPDDEFEQEVNYNERSNYIFLRKIIPSPCGRGSLRGNSYEHITTLTQKPPENSDRSNIFVRERSNIISRNA